MIRKLQILAFMTVVTAQFSYSQQRYFEFVCDGDTVLLSYTFIDDSLTFANHMTQFFPVYILDEATFDVATGMLTSNSASENLYNSLDNLQIAQDSLNYEHEAVLKEIIKHQDQLIILYKESFYDVSELNTRLSENLELCVDFAEKGYKSSSRRNFIWGGLAGIIVGLVTGVIVGT